MSVESLAKIANIKSPSDFLGAVMGRCGKADITREDILGALSGRNIHNVLFYWWLYDFDDKQAIKEAELVAFGQWVVHTPFVADRSLLDRFGCAALFSLKKHISPTQLIAQINQVTDRAVRENKDKYEPQKAFLIDLTDNLRHSLMRAKYQFMKHFIENE